MVRPEQCLSVARKESRSLPTFSEALRRAVVVVHPVPPFHASFLPTFAIWPGRRRCANVRERRRLERDAANLFAIGATRATPGRLRRANRSAPVGGVPLCGAAVATALPGCLHLVVQRASGAAPLLVPREIRSLVPRGRVSVTSGVPRVRPAPPGPFLFTPWPAPALGSVKI